MRRRPRIESGHDFISGPLVTLSVWVFLQLAFNGQPASEPWAHQVIAAGRGVRDVPGRVILTIPKLISRYQRVQP